MKKFLHPVFLVILFYPILSFSQLDGNGIAPNFTLTDIDGNSHTMYDYLDEGKVVILDFFATWCGPCNSNADEVERVWQDYGPDGTDEITMFLLESSGRSDSDLAALQSFINEHNVTCPTFDECEETNVPSDYEIGYFPTYYVVYSDRSYKQVSGSSTTIYQTMVDAIGENPGLSTANFDAKILEFEDPKGSFCTDSIRPKLTIQNYGTENLTAVNIKSIIDGEVEDTFNWTGSLAQYEIEQVVLNDITDIDPGEHAFTFTVEDPNGETDEENSNNSKDSEFIIIDDGVTLTLQINTDNYPTETSWELLDNDNNSFTSGDGFTNANSTYTKYVCVYSNSCYTFVLYDSYGDGNSGMEINIYMDGELIGTIDDFNSGSSTSVDFCTYPASSDNMFTNKIGGLSIYPNPFKDQLSISFNNEGKRARIKIYNQTGYLVKSMSTDDQKVELNTEDLSGGIYFVNIEIDNGSVTKKIVLIR